MEALSRRSVRILLLPVALLGLAPPAPQAAEQKPAQAAPAFAALGPAGAPASAFPQPARPVASIVSDEWSSEEERDKDGEAEQVLRYLRVHPGLTVADLGAGSGYYTVRAARRVGPNGRVIAEDVVPEYLDGLQRRLARAKIDNVALDLGEPHDPRLPPHSVDLVLMVHMYHEIEQPYAFLYNLLPALRKTARVAVIDLDRPTERHGTPRALLLCEFNALGFRQTHWDRLRNGGGYLAVFDPPQEMPRIDRIKACG